MTPSLEAAYAQPHRRYHTRAHIEQCLALLDQVPDLTDTERQILTYAIWWHDAVYDPTASDNEARSAQMAKADLRDFEVSIHAREEVARLIMLTAGHEVEEEVQAGRSLMALTQRRPEKLACASRSLPRCAGFGMTGFSSGSLTRAVPGGQWIAVAGVPTAGGSRDGSAVWKAGVRKADGWQ